jgi:hypothetical protein
MIAIIKSSKNYLSAIGLSILTSSEISNNISNNSIINSTNNPHSIIIDLTPEDLEFMQNFNEEEFHANPLGINFKECKYTSTPIDKSFDSSGSKDVNNQNTSKEVDKA